MSYQHPPRRGERRRHGGLGLIAAAATVIASCVAVAGPGVAEAAGGSSFSEDFSSNTLGSNLTLLDGSVNTSGGAAVLPAYPHGNIIGTVDTNYVEDDFCAEITVLDHPQPNNDNRAYFGLGRGALQGNADTSYPLAEPAVMIRHITSWAGTANNINNLTIAASANTAVVPATGATEITNQSGVGPGYGPYTLGIDFVAPIVTFLVDGVPFHDPVDISDYDFSGQARVFFAGQSVVFDDLSIASGSCFAPPPPPLDDPPSAVWGLGYLGHDGPAAVDDDGNVVQSGRFGGVRDFDPGPGEYLMDSADGNIFTVKFDATGQFVWAKQWTATQVYGVATGPDGSVYNVGQCHCENTDADPGPGVVPFPDGSNGDAFIQKLDADGNFAWSDGYVSGNHDNFETVATDAAGNVIVGGHNGYGGVARMYDSAGNELWTNAGPLATGSAFDAAGNAYTSGRGTTNKWAPDGTLIWSKDVLHPNGIGGADITFDDAGNLYISGGFTGTIDVDPGPGVHNVTSHSNLSIYHTDAAVVKLDSAGDFQWVATFGGSDNSGAGAKASVDADGNVWVAASFWGDLDADPGPHTHVLSTGSADPSVSNIAVIELDGDGDLRSAGVMTSLYNTSPTRIVAHPNGGLYLAGVSYGNPATIDVDPSADVLQLTQAGVFIARLGASDPLVTTVLMDPTTNDGSFESNVPPPGTNGINQAPVAIEGWTIESAGFGGVLTNPPHNAVLQAAEGADALFADGTVANPNTATATSSDLLDGDYPAVTEGDEFTWSFIVNSWSATSSGTLSLDFGNGPIEVGAGVAGDTTHATFATISGTYTATAADAAGGQLRAVLSVETNGTSGYVNVYGDDVRISVTHPDHDDDDDGQSDEHEIACGSDPLDAGSLSPDADGDGTPDCVDLDDDGDGVLDDNDAFPLDPNESVDTDGDGTGNNADTDDDNDGVEDIDDAFPLDSSESADCDLDGVGDNADSDDDNDGTPDATDAFPCDENESVDTDGDGTGNNADTDDDNDGVLDDDDLFPLDGTEWADNDGDGIGDNADTDDDNDGTPDATDAFPFDAGENADNDGDGIGDNADTDDDNDTVADVDDAFPFNPDEWVDCDGDGTGDNADLDDDNDTVADVDDAFPCDPDESVDTDGDGIGNNADTDDDGDGVLDGDDLFPLDGTEWADADGDGIGDNADPDDDNDGVADVDDVCAGSDISPTVVIQGADTGITNAVLADGCSMNDLIAQAIADATSQGDLSSTIAHLTNGWKKAGLITGKEKGKIQSTVTYNP